MRSGGQSREVRSRSIEVESQSLEIRIRAMKSRFRSCLESDSELVERYEGVRMGQEKESRRIKVLTL